MNLTAKRVERLLKKPGRYGDGHGLYLQVVSPRNASWVLRYERDGRERMLGLGPVHTVTLKEAREKARAKRALLLDGIDPLEQKRADKAAQPAALSFEAAAQQYFAQHEKKWRNAKHRAQFLSTLQDYAFPVIGKLSVAAIDTPLVLKVIEPIWLTKTETANRVRGRIEAVLDWANVRGYRRGDNPARWRGHLDNVLPARGQIQKARHHPAMPYSAVPAFVAALRVREGVAARALEFTILTAARTGETTGAVWSEVNLADKVWTVPAGRIKGGKEHRVPLSPRAVEILKALPRENGNAFVFIGPRSGGGLSNMAMSATLKRMGCADVTVHGFRSSFRDWAAETTGYPNHVVEMALAHTVGDAVERAYRRGDLFDKRTRLMADWARYCAAPVAAKKTAAVVTLR